jgi:hypothetical protein
MAAMRVENTCAVERKTLMDCSMNMLPLIWLPFLQRDSSRELGRDPLEQMHVSNLSPPFVINNYGS